MESMYGALGLIACVLSAGLAAWPSQAATPDFAVPPPPYITEIDPGEVKAGSPAFTLTVKGGNFLPDSVATWNGSNRATTYVSPTSLKVTIRASDVASAGIGGVTVYTPGSGRVSNTLVLAIRPRNFS